MNYFGTKLTLLFLILSQFVVAQQPELAFNHTSLTEVVKQVERQTSMVFNFDPTILDTYKFTGTLDLKNYRACIKQMLYDTPLAFQFSGSTVLVYLPEKQSIQIKGTIRDKNTNEGLAFANLRVDNLFQGTQTDETGNFELRFEGYKNQTITISYIGYESKAFQIQEVAPGTIMDIYLDIDEGLFQDEILVVDYILSGVTEGEGYSSVDMDFNRLSKEHTNIEQDLLRTVQLLPGITSIDESASNIQIRGSAPDQNLILWEGATLYDAGHLFGMVSAINPFLVDRVKVFKGVYEPSYDNRVGGIVDISLSDSIPKSIQAGLGTTFTESHGFIKAPIVKDKLALTAGIRNTVWGVYETPTLQSYSAKVFQDTKVDENEDEDNIDQTLEYYDFNTKLVFRPTSKWLIKGSYYQSANRFDFITDFTEEDTRIFVSDEVRSKSNLLSASASHDWSSKWNSEIRYTYSGFENTYFFQFFDEEDNGSVESVNVDNDLQDITLAFTNNWKFRPGWSMQFGYEWNQKNLNFNFFVINRYGPEYTDVNAVEGNFNNGFAALQYQNEKLFLNLGLRGTQYIEAGDLDLSPRLNFQYALHPDLKFKFSAGILQQYVSQLKEFGYNDLGIDNQPWVLIQPESGENLEIRKGAIGFTYQHKGWLLDVEGYFHELDGLSTLSPLLRDGSRETEFALGSAINKGIDVLLKKRWRIFSFWANYSLSQGQFLFEDLIEDPFPATNDQRHNLSLVNSVILKDWTFSLSYHWRSGLPYSRATEVVVEEDDDDVFYYIDYGGEANVNRLDQYGRLDFGVTYKKAFKVARKDFNLEIAASLINVLDRENIFSRNYFLSELDEENDEPELVEVDKFLLGRTGQVLMRVYF